MQSSPQTLLHPLSHLELHRGSPPWGGIVSECKRFVFQNQENEEEGTCMEATAHGDAKVRLTHMRGWDDGIGPCRVPGGTIVTFPTSSTSMSPAHAFSVEGLTYSELRPFSACLDNGW